MAIIDAMQDNQDENSCGGGIEDFQLPESSVQSHVKPLSKPRIEALNSNSKMLDITADATTIMEAKETHLATK